MPAWNQEAQVAAADHGTIDAGDLTQLSPGTAVRVTCGGLDIALVNDRGTVSAVANLCLRCSHPLSEGQLAPGLITCAHCGWQYELASGSLVGLPALQVETHGVSVQSGRMFVDRTPRPRTARPA